MSVRCFGPRAVTTPRAVRGVCGAVSVRFFGSCGARGARGAVFRDARGYRTARGVRGARGVCGAVFRDTAPNQQRQSTEGV